MRKLLPLLLLFFAVPGYADLIFTATLLPGNEVPPHATGAVGSITVDLHNDLNTLSVTETFADLSSPATAAHIHCCAPAGVNAAVALAFAGFPNTTSGTYNHTFDLSTDLFGGLAPAAFIAALEAGDTYANIHDAVFPGGEIRGQLEPAVPEPRSLLLAGSGLLGIAARIRRKLRG